MRWQRRLALIKEAGVTVRAFVGCLLLALLQASSAVMDAQSAMPASVANAAHDAQSATAGKLAFEVATIKPNLSDAEPSVNFTLGPGDGYADTGGRFESTNLTLLDYIRFAYKLSDGQVAVLQASAPQWIATKHFDIEAKAEAPHPTKDQMRAMMQSLLADRFQLSVHTEMRELPVLALVVARSGHLGPELHPHLLGDTDCSTGQTASADPSVPVQATALRTSCGGLASIGTPSAPSHVRIGGRKVTMGLLAAQLGEMGRFSRPVVDRTGLQGTYDLVLDWGPDAEPDATPGIAGDITQPQPEEERQAELLRALQEQLGLKLERQTAPFSVVLIDHVDSQPREN